VPRPCCEQGFALLQGVGVERETFKLASALLLFHAQGLDAWMNHGISCDARAEN